MVFTDEHRKKISLAITGTKLSSERIEKCKKNGKIYGSIYLKRATEKNSEKVINTKTGQVYNSIKHAAASIGIPKSTLNQYVIGTRKNKTSLVLLRNVFITST